MGSHAPKYLAPTRAAVGSRSCRCRPDSPAILAIRLLVFPLLLLAAPAGAWAARGAEPLGGAPARQLARDLALPAVTAEAFATVSVVRDVEYARPEGQPLRLDFYRPSGQARPVPCIVVIAGGGFRAQERGRAGCVAAYLATRGFAAASIDYRGTPGATFVATIQDTKAAVRWVRSHAGEYGLDPARIGAMGQSAGGHLAVMLAVTGGLGPFEGPGASPGVSSRIQAAVALAGVFDFISRLRDGGQQSHQPKMLETKRRTNGEWIGEPFSPASERWRRAAPISYVSADDAPVLFIHCRGDQTVPFAQSVQMCEVLRPLNPRCQLVLYEGGGHNILRVAGTNARMWEEAIAFLSTHLAP